MRIILNFSKGFGVAGVIILIFVLALLGFGGYTGYQYATNPMFDFYGFVNKTPVYIPQDLVPFVDGKNAEGILAYQPDNKLALKIDELLANYEGLPVKQPDLKAALMVAISPETAGNEDGAFIAAVQFTSAEKAQKVRDSVAFFATFARIAVELNDDMVLLKMHPELLEGSILENPLLKKSDPEWGNSELAILVDTSKGKSIASSAAAFFLADTLSSPDAANSAALAGYFVNYIEGYASIHENALDFHVAMDFVDRSELKTMSIPADVSTESIDTLYDASLKTLDTVIQNVNSSFQKPDALTQFKLDRVGLRFLADATYDLTKIEPLPSPTINANDAARKADLNTLAAAIESYYASAGSYPSKSQCVDALKSKLSDHLAHGMPVDSKGTQTFGPETCPYGYYYQYFGGDTYALWAHMENEENGNTDWPLVIESPADVVKAEGGTFGPYFVRVQGSGNITSQQMASQQVFSGSQETVSSTQETLGTTPAVRKIKRAKTPPPTQETVQ